MKTVGIIGGIGPESTAQYYKNIIAEYRKSVTDGSYPAIFINSIDMAEMLHQLNEGSSELVRYLKGELEKLKLAGADFAVLASNTPHSVFDELNKASPLPLISIVEAVAATASAQRLKKVALLGTKFTMSGSFYHDTFARHGITVVSPSAEQQAYIHHIYFDELVKGIVLPLTKQTLLNIIEAMQTEHGVEAVILGGTELSLIFNETRFKGMPFLDTTQIHIAKIVEHMLAV